MEVSPTKYSDSDRQNVKGRNGYAPVIHSSPLPNCRMIVYLNSLPLLELETNLPRPSPGEVLSILAFHQ